MGSFRIHTYVINQLAGIIYCTTCSEPNVMCYKIKIKIKKTRLVTGPVSILRPRNKVNPYSAGSNKQHYSQTLGILLIFTFITTYFVFITFLTSDSEQVTSFSESRKIKSVHVSSDIHTNGLLLTYTAAL